MTLKDLRAIMIAARPDDAGLPQFLSQWLDGHGAPVLDLEVVVDTKDGGTEKKTLAIHEREQTFVLPTSGRPAAVHIDPDDRVLIWRPEYGGSRRYSRLASHPCSASAASAAAVLSPFDSSHCA